MLEAFDGDTDLGLYRHSGGADAAFAHRRPAADSALFTMEPGFYEYRALARRLAELDDIEREEGWTVTPLGVRFIRTAERSRHMREYREHFADPDAFRAQSSADVEGGRRVAQLVPNVRELLADANPSSHPPSRHPTARVTPKRRGEPYCLDGTGNAIAALAHGDPANGDGGTGGLMP